VKIRNPVNWSMVSLYRELRETGETIYSVGE
jgi:hypothetical protein